MSFSMSLWTVSEGAKFRIVLWRTARKGQERGKEKTQEDESKEE